MGEEIQSSALSGVLFARSDVETRANQSERLAVRRPRGLASHLEPTAVTARVAQSSLDRGDRLPRLEVRAQRRLKLRHVIWVNALDERTQIGARQLGDLR